MGRWLGGGGRRRGRGAGGGLGRGGGRAAPAAAAAACAAAAAAAAAAAGEDSVAARRQLAAGGGRCGSGSAGAGRQGTYSVTAQEPLGCGRLADAAGQQRLGRSCRRGARGGPCSLLLRSICSRGDGPTAAIRGTTTTTAPAAAPARRRAAVTSAAASAGRAGAAAAAPAAAHAPWSGGCTCSFPAPNSDAATARRRGPCAPSTSPSSTSISTGAARHRRLQGRF